MTKKDCFDVLPLLLLCMYLCRLQLPFAEIWYCINDDLRYTVAKENNLRQ